MVSGFLVRWDGALISIDDIIYIEAVQVTEASMVGDHVYLHLREGHTVKWNKNHLGVGQGVGLLRELRELIKKAIEL